MKKKITIWQRRNNTDFVAEYGPGDFIHNHIEDGWVKNDIPVGDKRQTADWQNYEWRKFYGHLIDGRVVA